MQRDLKSTSCTTGQRTPQVAHSKQRHQGQQGDPGVRRETRLQAERDARPEGDQYAGVDYAAEGGNRQVLPERQPGRASGVAQHVVYRRERYPEEEQLAPAAEAALDQAAHPGHAAIPRETPHGAPSHIAGRQETYAATDDRVPIKVSSRLFPRSLAPRDALA